jgi:3',5'-nucleoside bisphosphate phosphatase
VERIDLHVHSSASDGTMSPQEVVGEAGRLGLRAIALTDHDTISGLEAALDAGKRQGIEVIPGCELSVAADCGELHILGLWVDPHSTGLDKALGELRASRHRRNERIVHKLRDLGVPITYDEVLDAAGGESVGRPHIASVLVAKKVVGSPDAAFGTFLGTGKPAHVPKEKLTAEQAIGLLGSEGCTTILAHPFSPGMDECELKALLSRLKAMGIDGVEAYYSTHSERQTGYCLRLAIDLGLVVSGGSDFHGSCKPQIVMGSGTGGLHIPSRVLEELKAYRRKRGQWT